MTAKRPRDIDHLVLPVHDLALASETYERMGFTLTPLARHPWGTCNRLAQFRGCFLEVLGIDRPELIGETRPGHLAFGPFVRDFLDRREGLAMLVLESADSDADIADYAAAGFRTEPRFDFERIARAPDGSERKVAFSLAFASPGPHTSAAPSEAGFFTCRQIFPENFWREAYQQHRNGAIDVAATVFVAGDPADHHAFLAGFVGTRELHMTSLGLEIATPRGRIEHLTPDGYRFRYGLEHQGSAQVLTGAAVRIAVADLAATAALLDAAGFASREQRGLLVVRPEEAHGVAYAFEQA